MKRLLILSILAVLLAIPAISLAGGGAGAGSVANITVQESYVNTSASPSVAATDNYTMKSGGLAFTVNDENPNDKSQGTLFKGAIGFAGPQVASNNANKKLGNLFMNMSGLIIGADNSAIRVGSGAINGSVTYTDPSNNQHNLTFTGSYSIKVTLSGMSSANGGNPTGGTAVITPTISSFLDENGNPMPIVLTMKLPAISFTVLGNGGAVKGGVVTGWSLQPDGAPSPFYLSLTKVGSLLGGMIVQENNSGTAVKMDPATGTIDGSGNINLQATDTEDTGTQDSNGNEIYTTTTITITGSVPPSSFGTPGAVASGSYSSTSGDSGSWSATEGTLSNWGMTITNPTAGQGGGGSISLTLEEQGDGSLLGMFTDNQGDTGMVSEGSFISPDLNMTALKNTYDNSGNPAIKTMTVTGTLTSGSFNVKGAVMSGSWSDDGGGSGTWKATEK